MRRIAILALCLLTGCSTFYRTVDVETHVVYYAPLPVTADIHVHIVQTPNTKGVQP